MPQVAPRRILFALAAVVALMFGLSGCGPDGSSAAGTSTSDTATIGEHNQSTDSKTDPSSGLPWINESALPRQAADTLSAIRSGGPYRYPRHDNVTYHNNNRALAVNSDGYYREYTVVTPGSKTRGARRIIKGAAGELFYTADHYRTFKRIREGA